MFHCLNYAFRSIKLWKRPAIKRVFKQLKERKKERKKESSHH